MACGGWNGRRRRTPLRGCRRLLLVRHRLANGEVQAAITELTDARRKQPDNPAVLVMLGQVQLANGQTADAIASYQQWVKLQPESSAATCRTSGSRWRQPATCRAPRRI